MWRNTQVINDRSGTPARYRSVIDGYCYRQLAVSTGTGDPGYGEDNDCPTTSIVPAIASDFEAGIKWLLNISDPLNLGLCVDPCLNPQDAPGAPDGSGPAVNAVYESRPNPFNPRTTIRFSLAQAGLARLVIYDVGGRKARTLADGLLSAGPHSLVWDGTDDLGRRVASGVYWSRLTAGDYSSNRRMVVLK